MKTRVTIATVASLLGLVLLGLLTHELDARRANAQRVEFVADDSPFTNGAATSTPSLTIGQQLPAEGAFQQPSDARYNGQPRQILPGPSVASSQPIVVATNDGPQLHGDTVNLGAFEFKTIFGHVSVPVSAIAGLRMADDPHRPATICLTNGDSLTGVLVTDSITIKTAWGGATIGREHIVSIVTTTEPVAWQLQNGRWKMILAEPESESAESGTDELGGEAEAAGEPAIGPDDSGPASDIPFQELPAADATS